jgi:hypothetical protein
VVAALVADHSLVALEPVPAEVREAAAGGNPVDLLDSLLADVADPEVARVTVEREPPGFRRPYATTVHPPSSSRSSLPR